MKVKAKLTLGILQPVNTDLIDRKTAEIVTSCPPVRQDRKISRTKTGQTRFLFLSCATTDENQDS